jgi:hypothetical protein
MHLAWPCLANGQSTLIDWNILRRFQISLLPQNNRLFDETGPKRAAQQPFHDFPLRAVCMYSASAAYWQPNVSLRCVHVFAKLLFYAIELSDDLATKGPQRLPVGPRECSPLLEGNVSFAH